MARTQITTWIRNISVGLEQCKIGVDKIDHFANILLFVTNCCLPALEEVGGKGGGVCGLDFGCGGFGGVDFLCGCC